jgi:hypothetical protein
MRDPPTPLAICLGQVILVRASSLHPDGVQGENERVGHIEGT